MRVLRMGITVMGLAVVSALLAGCTGGTNAPTPGAGGPGTEAETAAVRAFHFEYETKIAIPAGSGKVRIWVPLPQSDPNQTIDNLVVKSVPEMAHRIVTEAAFGNKIAFFESTANLPESLAITVAFDVTRKEVKHMPTPDGIAASANLLQGDLLAPITDEVKKRTTTATEGKADGTAKARGIYEKVLADMTYSKDGTGWGLGDIAHACDVGTGNCSDFHALFIAMSRAAQIPAFFEIGFPLPEDKTEGTIGGYHCWAWFKSDAGAWHPIDASEADKFPQKAEYFFGTICNNRVAFTRGRDLVLDPAPAAGPLNFMIYPHVEIDGQAVTAGIDKTFRFKDHPKPAAK